MNYKTRYYLLYCSWVISCIAFLGSLYYSEILGLTLCPLCWYQRCAMYPLIVILGIASYRGFCSIATYTLPLGIIGLLLASYHSLVHSFKALRPLSLCGSEGSCQEAMQPVLGFLHLPLLSLFAFLGISMCLSVLLFTNPSPKSNM